MKNANKIMNALEKIFPCTNIHIIEDLPMAEVKVYIDKRIIARFSDFFWNEEYNPSVEIKVKAPLKVINDFLEEVECDGAFYHAVERGLEEWREESHPNN